MKNILILIFFLTLSTQLFAQCEYEFKGMDELEKKEKVQTKDVQVMNPSSGLPVAFLSLGRLGTEYFICVKLNLDNSVCIDAESELTISTDTTVAIKLRKQGKTKDCSHPSNKGGVSFQYVELFYSVPAKTLEELSVRELRKIRISSSESNIDLMFGVKNLNKNLAYPFFKESVKCVLQ